MKDLFCLMEWNIDLTQIRHRSLYGTGNEGGTCQGGSSVLLKSLFLISSYPSVIFCLQVTLAFGLTGCR